MSEQLLVGVASVIILGIAAQWLAWRVHLPSILLLLIFGLIAGPATGFLRPDDLMGPVLFPIVSISVALILFEGGLSLRFSEIREVHGAVRNLITVGAMLTWVLASLASYLLLGLSLSLSVLFGAILVVTGPTVVIPLLRHVRPVTRVGTVAKWEGITIDPVGATLAVLVFEAILVGGLGATGHAAIGFLKTILIGIAGGAVGAGVLVFLLRRFLVPDFLQNPVTLMLVVAVFTLSNLFQSESGLLSVTLMGIGLANQRLAPVRHIIEFKENLRVLLISAVFILLAARLQWADFEIIGARSVAFVLVLILVVRPAAVFASTYRSRLNFRERLFLSWMAPRGIVAAAVASIFSLRLIDAKVKEATVLVPLTFFVIVSTVALYGLTAKPLAQRLRLAQKFPQGFLLLGAHPWSRQLGETLVAQGVQVVLADSNWENIRRARMSGLKTYYGNILADHALDEIDLDGIGRFLALTPNDEANSLACLHFIEAFGRAEVYQLPPQAVAERRERDAAAHLMGRLLFGPAVTYNYLSRRFQEGSVLKVTKLTKEFGFKAFLDQHGPNVTPLFLIGGDRTISIFSTDRTLTPSPGQTLISLVEEDESAQERGD